MMVMMEVLYKCNSSFDIFTHVEGLRGDESREIPFLGGGGGNVLLKISRNLLFSPLPHMPRYHFFSYSSHLFSTPSHILFLFVLLFFSLLSLSFSTVDSINRQEGSFEPARNTCSSHLKIPGRKNRIISHHSIFVYVPTSSPL